MNKRQAKKKRNKSIYRDTWNLDWAIAKFTLPRLIRFKEVTNGYPGHLESMEQWYEILDKIIAAFTIIVKDNDFFYNKDDQIIVDEGLDLFRKYYFDLWW